MNMSEGISRTIKLLIMISLIWWFIASRREVWMGFYYPGGNISGDAIYSPEVKDKEACIRWAEDMWHSRPSDRDVNPQDLYECGKNCEIRNAGLGLYQCKQTFDGGDWRRGDYGE